MSDTFDEFRPQQPIDSDVDMPGRRHPRWPIHSDVDMPGKRHPRWPTQSAVGTLYVHPRLQRLAEPPGWDGWRHQQPLRDSPLAPSREPRNTTSGIASRENSSLFYRSFKFISHRFDFYQSKATCKKSNSSSSRSLILPVRCRTRRREYFTSFSVNAA